MQYISVEHQKAISGSYRTASIIVLAFCVAVVMFMVIPRFIEPREVVPGSERLIRIYPAVIICMALSVIILRRVWLSRVIFGTAAKNGVGAVLNKLVQMTIICAAISESVAVFGLVFYFMTGGYQYSVILSVVSLILLFYTAFPRRGEWERAVAASASAQGQ
jgi:hypothetical protein